MSCAVGDRARADDLPPVIQVPRFREVTTQCAEVEHFIAGYRRPFVGIEHQHRVGRGHRAHATVIVAHRDAREVGSRLLIHMEHCIAGDPPIRIGNLAMEAAV